MDDGEVSIVCIHRLSTSSNCHSLLSYGTSGVIHRRIVTFSNS